MATVVSAIGCSHSPMLPTNPRLWLERADQDRNNPMLYDHSGQHVTFDELEAAAGDRYAQELDFALWERRYAECEQALDRLAHDVAAIGPEVAIVIGDDQGEAFERSSEPAVAVFWGDRWRTMILDQNAPGREPGEFYELAARGYAMDEVFEFDGHRDLGLDVITSLVREGFDVMSVASVPEGRGFGHAFGFIIRRVLRDLQIPVVPVFLNTYYPPNQPTPARCYDFGEALGRAISASALETKVLLVASGGLSHFVLDEGLDTDLLDAIAASDRETLRSIPPELLQAGSSEIRNWIAVAGAMAGRGLVYREYVPCYRTIAGTGCGMGFVRWE